MKPTKFEKEIKDAIKKGHFEVVKLSKNEKDVYREAARATLAKDKIITIRINGNDLKAIKDIAIKSGKRYQTYIGELLHELAVKRRKVA